MTIQYTVSLLFLLIFLYSCNEHENKKVLAHFEKTESLFVSDSILLEPYGIFNPHYIYHKDSFLIFNSMRGNRDIQLLDLHRNKVYNFSVIGQGPLEMNNYFTVSEQSSDCFKFADNARGKIYGITLKTLRSDSLAKYSLIYSLPQNSGVHFIRFMETPNEIVGVGILGEGRFGVFDKSTFSYTEQMNYPSDSDIAKLDNRYKGALFSRTIMIPNVQGNRFVSACFGLLDFYAITDKGILRLLKSSHYHFPKFTKDPIGGGAIAFDKEDPAGFTSLIADEQYVYVLYSDKSFDQYGDSAYSTAHLLVYDWEGNPVKHNLLNRELYHITINGNKLFGLSRSSDPIVYCIELEKLH